MGLIRIQRKEVLKHLLDNVLGYEECNRSRLALPGEGIFNIHQFMARDPEDFKDFEFPSKEETRPGKVVLTPFNKVEVGALKCLCLYLRLRLLCVM